MKGSMDRAVARSSQLKTLWGLTLLSGAMLLSVGQEGWAAEGAEAEAVSERSQQVARSDREKRQPATTVKEWMAQIEETEVAEVTEITGVEVNATETGLNLVLQTTGSLETPATFVAGNTLTAEIVNAVLALPEGETFERVNPVAGVAQIRVTNVPGGQARVEIVGTDAPPVAEVTAAETGLVFAVTPGTAEVAESEDEEIEITVTAEREDDGYNPSSASTATRTDTPLRDIPQSIQIVPKEVIEDQGVTRIGDALRNVSGVTPQRDRSNASDRFSIRGFDTSRILVNGFRSGVGLGDAINISPNVVERIEVLKGPASVLYGQVEPGGVVNYVTKQPLNESLYDLQIGVGNFGLIEPAIDLTGPLTKDGQLTYRLNASYQNSDSFRDFVEQELISVSPVIRYDFSDNTNLTFGYGYLKQNQTFDDGLPIDPIIFEIPRGRFLGEPDDFFNTATHRFNLTLNHRFNENIQLRSGFFAELFDSSETTFRLFEFDPEMNEISRFVSDGESSNNNLSWQTDLTIDFKTGSIEHRLLAGFELARTETSDDSEGFFDSDTPLAINVVNPQYGTPIPNPNTNFTANDTVSTLGFYLQDQITLLPSLKLLLGGRYDFARNESEFEEFFEGEFFSSSSEFSSGAFSPRVGIVYQPIEPISIYASYSRSFTPNTVSTADGEIIEPERGTQYEVGVRGEFGDVSVNLAAYDITKTNITRTDPNDPDFSIPIGKVRSRGIELDITGEITSGWNIIGSLFFNDAFISEGDGDNPEGDTLINAPSSGASLWTTYEVQTGALQGLGFGAGLFYVGDREAELPNDLVLPSYVRADASLFYNRNNWRIGLNFKNLFNTRYFESSQNTSLIYPGAPFTVLGTILVRF